MRFKALLEQHQQGIDEDEPTGLDALELLMGGGGGLGEQAPERAQPDDGNNGNMGSRNQSQINGQSLQWNNSHNLMLNFGGPSMSQMWPIYGLGVTRTDSLMSRRNSRTAGRTSNPPENLNFLLQSRVNSRDGGAPITRQNSILDCLRQLERFGSIANLQQNQEAQQRLDSFQLFDSRRVSQGFNPQFGVFGAQNDEKVLSRIPSFKSPIKPKPQPVEEALVRGISFDGKQPSVGRPKGFHHKTKLQQRREVLSALRKQPSKQMLVRIETKKHLHKEVQRQYVQCVCKKTKCLKLYCICFKNGITCSDLCDCTGCMNKGVGIMPSESVNKQREFRQKVLHKLKVRKELPNLDCCNCRKSFCQNQYCKCYQSKRGCGPNCTCISCKNRQRPPT